MDLPSAKEEAVLELLLGGKEMYGLEMVKADVGLKRGTIYVTLGRMEEVKWVTSRVGANDLGGLGPPRRLYRITGLGARALAARRAGREAEQAVLLGATVGAGI